MTETTEHTEQASGATTRGAGVTCVVSLGDTYADTCCICGGRGIYGLATQRGPEGCVEALKCGEVYCLDHLPEIRG